MPELMKHEILLGDCLEVLRGLPDNSVDSVVTDPPYGLAFMGKKWDYDVPSVQVWQEVLRVLKPGGHALVACGTRTQHRMAVNLEDAGFEIRDIVAWVYGSGFPKSLNVGKSVDKLQGNEREVVGEKPYSNMNIKGKAGYIVNEGKNRVQLSESRGTSEWEGWGTALKPAMELWTLCRKPLSEKNVAENCLKWGVGGINIDACRVDGVPPSVPQPLIRPKGIDSGHALGAGTGRNGEMSKAPGRFPANLIHDGSDEVVGLFPETNKSTASKRGANRNGDVYGEYGLCDTIRGHNDNGGSASRFFYCAKASKSERGEGNNHPTVKPVKLMKYLITLITPKNGIVLEPFGGSGTTAVACVETGNPFIIIEREPEYIEIIKKRVQANKTKPDLFNA